jgi:fumarate hydratase subunit alpha
MPIKVALMVKQALMEASTTFREDQLDAYHRALREEENENARWVLEIMLENARIAQSQRVPLCDDTGIPHVLVEVGPQTPLPMNFLSEVEEGIAMGLRELPGRPMAVRGDDINRMDQKQGLYDDPGEVVPPAFLVDKMDHEGVKIHVLMLGGGPEIRAHTHRVFHRRDHRNLFKEALTWMISEIPKLGCTPCIPAVGIGRTHFEASSLMLKAMAHGNLNQQSELELCITNSLNHSGVGSMGLGGSVTALGALVKVGPQRASGVRVICMRPCCSVEPRKSSIHLSPEILE